MEEERRRKLLALYYVILKRRDIQKRKKSKSRKRRIWVKDIFKEREHEGAFALTIQKLRFDRENHFR